MLFRSNPWYYSDAPKTLRPQLDLARRTSSFDEVQGGLTEANALFEARRCLSCGNCFECDNCYGVCPDNAVIKLAADDLHVIQKVPGLLHAIGIAYDTKTRQVWVAGYLGNVWVLEDLRRGEKTSKQLAKQKAREQRAAEGGGKGKKGKDRGTGGRNGGRGRGRGG